MTPIPPAKPKPKRRPSPNQPRGRVVHPSLDPQPITDLAWYYENAGSVEVFIQSAIGVNAISVRIPWRKLMASAVRCGRAPLPAGRKVRGGK